jgi:hypothetical protein
VVNNHKIHGDNRFKRNLNSVPSLASDYVDSMTQNDLSMFHLDNPDIELFNLIDGELIKLAGSEILIYRYEGSKIVDDIYDEDRQKIINPVPIKLYGHYDPRSVEETLSEFGLEIENDQIFTFNLSEIEKKVGRKLIPGDIIKPLFQDLFYEVFEAQEASFEVYGVYHLNVTTKLLRDSDDRIPMLVDSTPEAVTGEPETYKLSNDTYEWVFSKRFPTTIETFGPYLQFDYIKNKETGHTIDMSHSALWQLDMRLAPTNYEDVSNYCIPSSYYSKEGGPGRPAGVFKAYDKRDYVSIDSTSLQNGKLKLKWENFSFNSVRSTNQSFADASGGSYSVEMTVQVNENDLDLSLKVDIGLDSLGQESTTSLASIRFPYLNIEPLGEDSKVYATIDGGEVLLDPVGNGIYMQDSDDQSQGAGMATSTYPAEVSVPLHAFFDGKEKYGIMLYDHDPELAIKGVYGSSFYQSDAFVMYQRHWPNLKEEDIKEHFRRTEVYTRSWNTSSNLATDGEGNPHGYVHKIRMFEGIQTEAINIFFDKYNPTLPSVYDNPNIPSLLKNTAIIVWPADNPENNFAENALVPNDTDSLWLTFKKSSDFYRENIPESTMMVQPLTWVTNPWETPNVNANPPDLFFGHDGTITGSENRSLIDRIRPGLINFLKEAHTEFSPLWVTGNKDTGRHQGFSIVEHPLAEGVPPEPFEKAPGSDEWPSRNLQKYFLEEGMYNLKGNPNSRKERKEEQDEQYKSCCSSEKWRDETYRDQSKAIIDVFEGTLNTIKLTGNSGSAGFCYTPIMKGSLKGVPSVSISVTDSFSIPTTASFTIQGTELKVGVDWSSGGTELEVLESIKEALSSINIFSYIRHIKLGLHWLVIDFDTYGDNIILNVDDSTEKGIFLQYDKAILQPTLTPYYSFEVEDETILRFNHDWDIHAPLGYLKIHGVESRFADGWESMSFGYSLNGPDDTPYTQINTWGTTPSVNARNMADAINASPITKEAIQAEADGPNLILRSAFEERGSKTRVTIEPFENKVYLYKAEALAEIGPIDIHTEHPVGSNAMYEKDRRDAVDTVNEYGSSIALNNQYISGNERHNRSTSLNSMGEAEHHIIYPHSMFTAGYRTMKDKVLLSNNVIGNSTRGTLLQKSFINGSPRGHKTMLLWLTEGRLNSLLEYGVDPKDLTDPEKAEAIQNLLTKLGLNDEQLKAIAVYHQTYALLYYLLYEQAPPNVVHCSEQPTNYPKGWHGGKVSLSVEFDGYPSHPALDASAISQQEFAKELAEIYSSFKEYFQKGRIISGTPLDGFYTSKPDSSLWFLGQNNSYSFIVKNVKQHKMANTIATFNKQPDGTGLFLIGNYTLHSEGEGLITLDFKEFFGVEDANNIGYQLREVDKNGNDLQTIPLPFTTTKHQLNFNTSPLTVRIFIVEPSQIRDGWSYNGVGSGYWVAPEEV